VEDWSGALWRLAGMAGDARMNTYTSTLPFQGAVQCSSCGAWGKRNDVVFVCDRPFCYSCFAPGLFLTDSLGPTKASAAVPIVNSRLVTPDIMHIYRDDEVTNPRTVQHKTINGAGLVARVLRGKR